LMTSIQQLWVSDRNNPLPLSLQSNCLSRYWIGTIIMKF
jgi:hypothetical protein